MKDLEKAFWKFHKRNPHIYDLIVKFALDAKKAGHRQYGIGAIFERIRWHVDIETDTDDEFKLNCNHRSRYARLVMSRNRKLKRFFKIRSLRGSTSTTKTKTPVKKKRKRTPIRKA